MRQQTTAIGPFAASLVAPPGQWNEPGVARRSPVPAARRPRRGEAKKGRCVGGWRWWKARLPVLRSEGASHERFFLFRFLGCPDFVVRVS